MKKHAQRGQVLPLVGIAILALVAVVGFSVDVGYHQYRQRIQQTATDSAALAAASQFNGSYQAAAWRDAASNGFTDGTTNGTCTPSATVTCVTVSEPPVSPDAFAGQANAVEVTIIAPSATFFEKVFGINNVTISTKAVAILTPEPANTCLLTLSPTQGANFNSGSVNAPNCGLTFDGATNFRAGTIDAAAIDCASTCSNGTYTGASPTTVAPVGDPCGGISFCSYLSGSKTRPTCTGTAPSIPKTNPVVVQPGCYPSGFTIHNSDVQLTCGLYVIQGTVDIEPNGSGVPGKNSVTQTCSPPGGVTLYVDTGGALTFKDVNVNLAAPTSGDYTEYSAGEQNALVYQVPGNTNSVNFQSVKCTTCNISLTGMLYAPSANLNYNASSGTSNGSGILVIANTANFNGGFAGLFGAPGAGNLTIQTAVLGE